jgi:uncharacterized RDD family membrane protein YckC
MASPGAGALPFRLAPLSRRLGALLYEALLFVAMAFVAGFVFLPFVSPTRSETSLSVPAPAARVVMFAALVAAFAVYYTWSWSNARRTLPQKTWRLRVVDAAGRPLRPSRAFVRYVAAWIGPALALGAYALLAPGGHARSVLALALAGYCFALVDRDHQFLHDRIAGSYVAVDP